jgi:hypothetical protein
MVGMSDADKLAARRVVFILVILLANIQQKSKSKSGWEWVTRDHVGSTSTCDVNQVIIKMDYQKAPYRSIGNGTYSKE